MSKLKIHFFSFEKYAFSSVHFKFSSNLFSFFILNKYPGKLMKLMGRSFEIS